MAGPLAVRAPIPATPAAHGLLSVATEATGPERWELGEIVCPENCVEASTWDPDCSNWPVQSGEVVKPEKSDPPDNLDCYPILPFVVESAFSCASFGFQSVDYVGRARRQLEAATQKGMEWEVWTGTQKPDNPHLTAGATVIGDTVVGFSLKDGLALASQALANCAHGGVGVIHAPPWVVGLWQDSGQLKEQGDRLVTVVRGDRVIAGSGYPGTGPGGIAPGDYQSWIYATGPLQYRLGEIRVEPETLQEAEDRAVASARSARLTRQPSSRQAQALDRLTNVIEYRAERLASVNFDPCCHFALLVERCEPTVS